MHPYLSIARVDNWPKNFLMFAGVLLAYHFAKNSVHINVIQCLSAFLALCFASSANYVINEYLDSDYDRVHPLKNNRALVSIKKEKKIIVAEYLLLVILALILGSLSYQNKVILFLVIYIVLGWGYNIPPVRLKDVAYIDVLLESANYPLRILVGWATVAPHSLPSADIILTAWAIGAFMMSMKRVAEYSVFKTTEEAIIYRKSYAQYSNKTLILSGFIYGLFVIFGLTTLLQNAKTELLILIPPLIAYMGWYFFMGLEQKKEIIFPEKLFFNRLFMGFLVLLFLTILLIASS